MFALVTGTPGAGKTSSTLLRFKDVKDRPVFYRGIRDLSPELGWFELTDEQARDWHENVPEGGIVIIDEAQQLFPVRPSSREVPAGLKALETHRHKGWDVIFITQEPGLLDSHARKIANEHFHYVRPFQAPMITEYHCGTGAISPSNRADLARCSQSGSRSPKRRSACITPPRSIPTSSTRRRCSTSWVPWSSRPRVRGGGSSAASALVA